MKLVAAYAALKRIQDGTSTWNTKPRSTTLRTCLRVMIHASDNHCHDDIVAWLGSARLTRIAQSLGMSNTFYGSLPASGSILYAGNRSTTNDLAAFVRKLERGELLSPKYTRILRDYMHSQIFRTRIASGIPPGVYQASKPGALWISSGLLQGDTAIVRGPQTSFVISIIATGGVPKSALSALARTAYTHFFGSFGSAASYPLQQMRSTRSTPMRSSPGGAVVGTLPGGRNVEVTTASRVWYKIRYGSQVVWVDSRALRNR
nr:serine hydrolase [Microbacterium thalassium]